MHREADLAVGEASHLEVEPALGVALVVGALGVAGRPDGVVVIAIADHLVHVARVEIAIEKDVGLSRFFEGEGVALG